MTDDGIARLANALQSMKAQSPMLATDDGIARLANELHPSKALSPMLVTDDGMVTCVTLVLSTPHSFHESSPPLQPGPLMVVVPSGMAKCTPPWPSDGSAAAAASAAAAILGCLDVATQKVIACRFLPLSGLAITEDC